MCLKVLGGGGAQPECTCGFSRGPPWAEVTVRDGFRVGGLLQGSRKAPGVLGWTGWAGPGCREGQSLGQLGASHCGLSVVDF